MRPKPKSPAAPPPPPPPVTAPAARNPALALAAILLVAAVLRLLLAADTSYWLDEFLTAELSTGRGLAHLHLPVGEVIPDPPATTRLDGAPGPIHVWLRMQDATHPPLFFLVLRLWREIVGDGDAAGRMLSVVSSLVAIALLYDVVRRLHGVGPALWAAAIMALAQPQVRYGYELRNYAFLLAIALGAASALIRIEQGGGVTRFRWVALMLCSLAMMLTHYLVAGALAAMFLYALLRLRGRTRLLTAAAFVAAGAGFLLLWGPWFLAHLRSYGGQNATTAFLQHRGGGSFLAAWALSLCSQPVIWLSGDRFPSPAWQLIAATSGLLLVVPWFLLRRRPELLLWMLWLALAVGFVATVDLTRHTRQLGFVRYTLLASPAAYALLAALCWRLDKPWQRHALPAVGLLIAAASVPALARQQLVYDWRVLAATLQPEASRGGTLLIFSAPGREEWFSRYFYLAYSHYAGRKRPAVLLLDRPASPETLRRVGGYPNVWMVSATPVFPDQLLPGYAGRLYSIDGFENAIVWKLEPGPVTPATRPSK